MRTLLKKTMTKFVFILKCQIGHLSDILSEFPGVTPYSVGQQSFGRRD